MFALGIFEWKLIVDDGTFGNKNFKGLEIYLGNLWVVNDNDLLKVEESIVCV
jgi:hypothetical protein